MESRSLCRVPAKSDLMPDVIFLQNMIKHGGPAKWIKMDCFLLDSLKTLDKNTDPGVLCCFVRRVPAASRGLSHHGGGSQLNQILNLRIQFSFQVLKYWKKSQFFPVTGSFKHYLLGLSWVSLAVSFSGDRARYGTGI